MDNILLVIYIFLDLIKYVIFIYIIISWLQLFGMKIQFQFINNIIHPLFSSIQKYIPTRIGMFDFTPIILLFIILFFQSFLLTINPSIKNIFQL